VIEELAALVVVDDERSLGIDGRVLLEHLQQPSGQVLTSGWVIARVLALVGWCHQPGDRRQRAGLDVGLELGD